MDKSIMGYVDYTLLKATATWEDVERLCKDALRLGAKSVCIPPSYVKPVREAFAGLTICTVIGFPLGYDAAEVKVLAAKIAIDQGADEIDMVVNLTHVKNGAFPEVLKEITMVKQAIGEHILKVIVEACYLTEDEKIKLCALVTEGGADFIKTSTGFGPGGAALEDVALFRKHIGAGVSIKAAGGIRSREDMEAFLRGGCQRIGSSASVEY